MKKYYLYLCCVMAGLLFVTCEEVVHNFNVGGSIGGEGLLFNGQETEFYLNVGDAKIKRVEYWLTSAVSAKHEKIGESTKSPFLIKFTPKDLSGDYVVSVDIEASKGGEGYIVPGKDINIRLSLGENFQGGTVVELTGDGLHGLIVSDSDMIGGDRTLFQWGPANELGLSRTEGMANTTILATKAQNDFEMGYWFKKSFAHNGYEDWYIPSLEESKKLKSNKMHLKNIKNHFYWTSSELGGEHSNFAYFIDFNGEFDDAGIKKNSEQLVRLVRKF